MLSDNVINVSQRIMAQNFSVQLGLQDTLLVQKTKFKSVPVGNFVQILHDGKYHWVAISTHGCEQGEVIYMDSLFRRSISNMFYTEVPFAKN